ncbi:MAG: hypothetical protein IKO11_00555 [Lachnospiraceae bacterium]|nr:hypothetical protein [Lachnospiraceae bacterium]
MKKKLIPAVLALLLMGGCGEAKAPADPGKDDKEKVEVTSEVSPTPESVKKDDIATPTEEAAPTEAPQEEIDWKGIYAEFLDSGIEQEIDYLEPGWRNSWTLGFIYLNKDDIPELVISSGYEAAGNIICTILDGKVSHMQTARLGIFYKERGNVLDNCDGNMGYYHDYIYSIGKDGFDLNCEGTNNEVYGENGPTGDMEYALNGNSVSEEKYYKTLDGMIRVADRRHYGRGSSYTEVMNFLTGQNRGNFRDAYAEMLQQTISSGFGDDYSYALIRRKDGDPLLLCIGDDTYHICSYDDGILFQESDSYFEETMSYRVYHDAGVVQVSQYLEDGNMYNSYLEYRGGAQLYEFGYTYLELDEDGEPRTDANDEPIRFYELNSSKVTEEVFEEYMQKYDAYQECSFYKRHESDTELNLMSADKMIAYLLK